MAHESYIYYDAKTSAFTENTRARTYTRANTAFFYYDASPDTALEGVELEISNGDSVTVYRGESSSGEPQTELEQSSVYGDIAIVGFEATFGNTNSTRLVIAVVQEGGNTPTLDEKDFYATVIVFRDGSFRSIVPNRQNRGGGVTELADGTLVQYKGFGGNKWRWRLEARFVEKAMIDKLDKLYADRPEFMYAQNLTLYPDRNYKCVLENSDFRIPYSGWSIVGGYTIVIEIGQV